MLDIKRIFELGKQVILVEFDLKVNPSSLEKLLKIKSVLQNAYSENEVEITNTYHCLALRFNSLYNLDISIEKQKVKEIMSSISSIDINGKITTKLHEIPVCYEDEFALDLDYLSTELKVPKQELIKLHSEPTYHIYFLGFLPGFLYLGGLNEAIHFPRKKTPRLKIPKGSVGIGGSQTGIYPSESPGGWQLIGNCPLNLFNVNANPPSKFQAGDQIQFKVVTKKEHQQIKKQVLDSDYQHLIKVND